jgi:hypothetical protein
LEPAGVAVEFLGEILELWYIERTMKPFVFFLVLLLGAPAFSSGCRHPDPKNSLAPLTLEGRVYVTGNEPFTELALETKVGEVYILGGDLTAKLRTMQGQWVRLRGTTISDRSFLYSSKGLSVEEVLAILPEGENHE